MYKQYKNIYLYMYNNVYFKTEISDCILEEFSHIPFYSVILALFPPSEQVVRLHSLKDCVDFLWTETGMQTHIYFITQIKKYFFLLFSFFRFIIIGNYLGGQKVTHQIEQQTQAFNAKFENLDGASLQKHKV